MTLDLAVAQRFAEASRAEFERALASLVEIPSVSAEPEHRPDLDRAAVRAAEILTALGGQAEILETPGAPLVTGGFVVDPGLPTVTIYNHLDVQPAGEPEWRSQPFRFTREGQDIYRGRGTTDDKGPALTAAWGAKLAREQGVPLNIRVLWELEEEIGSPNFRAGLERHRAALATQSIVVSDTVWLTRGKPSTPAGLRGMQSFTLSLVTGAHDLHSGLVGGAARNPFSELVSLAAEMFDGRSGQVKIPGFYDDAVPLSEAEAASFRASGFRLEQFLRDHHQPLLRSHDADEVMARVWAQPTMEIHGFAGGYSGPGVKSAVPARAELKMSCRLVPNMRGARVMELISAFVRARAPDVVVRAEGRLEAYRGLTAGPYAEAVLEGYQFGFGERAAIVREGVSIGAVPTMAEILGAPILFMGLSLPEHGYHAPNEFYDWPQAAGGMAAFAKYFERVAQIPR